MDDEDRSPVIHDKKTIQEVIRDWICERYKYSDDTLGCEAECDITCPGRQLPVRQVLTKKYKGLKKHSPENHAPLPKGDSVATECPKCGCSLIDMDWELLEIDGGALLCPNRNCNHAFTEPPNLQGEVGGQQGD